jgi:hypothetical protein
MAATILGALAAAPAAPAANFTAEPPAYVQSGAGPFTWTFEASFVGAPVAYKLSTEPEWHRCDRDGAATMADLPEGRHSIAIADEPSFCTTPYTALAGPDGQPTVRELAVDRTPPLISEPSVRLLRFSASPINVEVSLPVGDALSGVQTVIWTWGDGTPPQRGSTYWGHRYPVGTWTGSVTVTDRVGNAATRSFVVTVPPPRQAPAWPPDKTPPAVSLVKVGTRLLGREGLLVRATTTDRGVVSVTGTARIAGRPFALRKAGVRLGLPEGPGALHVTASARVRRIVRRALARRLPVQAELRVRAQDALGNARVVRHTVRVRG